MTDKKVIITGASGFVGTYMTPYLLNLGYEVFAVNRNPKAGEISYTQLTPDFLNDTDAVIHLAGKAHDVAHTTSEAAYYKINTELTQEVCKRVTASNCKQFVYLSSVKAVADTVVGVLTEHTPPNPKTPYGKSKRAAETFLTKQQALYPEKKIYILRPCMIHGPGNKGNLNLLFQLVKKGIPYPLGAFTNKRSFLSIENLCFVIHNLLQHSPEPGIYNLADAETLSTVSVVALMASSFGKEPKIWNIAPHYIKGLAKVGDALHLPFTTERLKKLTENYPVDATKILKVLSITLPVSAQEGMLQTFQSFQKKQS